MDDMQPLVSVIFPVYGVEDYVEGAVRSVLAQTYDNYEIFLVDDGSKDRSGEVCDRLAEEDSRITVFHTPNGGAPAARNHAMEHANGKYYYFMDSDDWTEPTMLEDMVALAERTQAQLVITGFYIDQYYSDTEYVTEIKTQPSAVYDQTEFRANAWKLFENNMINTPWNKLFLRSYIDGIGLRWPDIFWDDVAFCTDAIRDMDKVAVSSTPYYHFLRKRSESETAKYREGVYERNEAMHDQIADLYDHWGQHDADSETMIARRYIDRFFVSLENVANPKNTASRQEKIATIKMMMDKPTFRHMLAKAKYPSLHMKMMQAPLFLRSPLLTYVMGDAIGSIKRKNIRVFGWLKAHR